MTNSGVLDRDAFADYLRALPRLRRGAGPSRLIPRPPPALRLMVEDAAPRGATPHAAIPDGTKFQSTPPRGGDRRREEPRPGANSARRESVQSRPRGFRGPRGDREGNMHVIYSQVSIHAPARGDADERLYPPRGILMFNPRPARGRLFPR